LGEKGRKKKGENNKERGIIKSGKKKKICHRDIEIFKKKIHFNSLDTTPKTGARKSLKKKKKKLDACLLGRNGADSPAKATGEKK